MTHVFSTNSTLSALLELGRQLDRDIYPRVLDCGIVMPSGTAIHPQIWATKEQDNEKRGKGRPATGPWQGTSGWQRPSDGDRTSGSPTPVVCSELKESYEADLEEVMKSYPNSRVWHQDEGFWLLTESQLLPGLWQKAVFLTGIPYARNRTIRAWGFWAGIPLAHPVWIGPRHTNFPDGSVCAFEPEDGTWNPGGSLVTLIDLYTIWALRHLHLQAYGRWPGRQVAHFGFERIVEMKQDEICICGLDKLYGDCCQPKDLSSDIIAEAVHFSIRTGHTRRPHEAVANFLREQAEIPRIVDLLPVARRRKSPLDGLHFLRRNTRYSSN